MLALMTVPQMRLVQHSVKKSIRHSLFSLSLPLLLSPACLQLRPNAGSLILARRATGHTVTLAKDLSLKWRANGRGYNCECLSVCLFVCLSVCVSDCLSVCPSLCKSLYLPRCLSPCLSLFLSVHSFAACEKHMSKFRHIVGCCSLL